MKRKLFWLILIAALLLLTIIPPVYGSEFVVHSVEEDQISPAVAFNNTSDEFLVVWEEYYWKGIKVWGITGQRISENGNHIGETFPVVGDFFHLFTNPHLVYNPSAHEYLLVWEHYEHESDDHHIYARRLSSNGAAIGSDIHIAADTSKFECNPQVAYNPTDNEYFIVWQERNIPIGYEYCLKKISGQRLSSTGSLLGSHISILDEFTDQLYPAVAFNSAQGHYLIVWQEHKLDGSGETDIYGQRIGRTGAHVGGKIAVSTYVRDQIKPRLAYNNKANEFLVVWEDHQGKWGEDRDIYGQRVTAGGIPQGGNFLISWEGNDLRFHPDIAYNPWIDEYLVTWEHTTYSGSGPYYYVYHNISQRSLASDGTRIGGEQMVSTQGISPQTHPAIAPADTSYLIVWEDGRNTTIMATDLYGALIQRDILSGHVYEGNIGDESTPLSNVAIDLYCSNNAGQVGSLLTTTTTDATGSYTIMLDNVCEYYNIVETDPTGYISTGASSAGRIINDNWIELTYPLSTSEMEDNDFWDNAESPPGNWTAFSPTGWVTSQSVTCTVKVEDTGSGLDVSTAQYAYTTGTTWSSWKAASCTGSDGTNSPQTITAHSVPFGKDSTTTQSHRIKFRIADMSGIAAESPSFDVSIDTTPPTNPTLAADRDTHAWLSDPAITISWSGASDAASGIENYFYQWSTSSQTVPDENLSTTATTLSTTIPSEGTTNYFHLITIDTAGNRAHTAVHLGPFYLDTSAPAILSGPAVSSATSSSATITWQTSEEADSTVKYTNTAGPYTMQETESSMVTAHSIFLTSLTPSTTYRLMVTSADVSGKKVESGEIAFETPGFTDTMNPAVSLIDPGICKGRVTIAATASDDTGVECVVFSIDGDTLGIDYTAPYKTLWDTEKFTNKDYIITAKAIDYFGKSSIDSINRGVQNFRDVLAPTVEIISPTDGGTVSGQDASLYVKVQDDSDRCRVEVFLDDNPITFCNEFVIPNPAGPQTCLKCGTSFSLNLTNDPFHTFFWDSRLYNGPHTIKVMATDNRGSTGFDTVAITVDNADLSPFWDRPKLEITRHEVTRVGNYLELSLRVENIGGSIASNIKIEESLKAFQVERIYNSSSYHIAYDTSTMEGSFVINEDSIGAQPHDYTIFIVPVLIYPNPPTPSIGDYIDLSYQGEDGSQYNENLSGLISDIEIIYNDAVKEADYLIVTNPTELFSHHIPNDVNTLLSDMARLAEKKNGVLGYMHIIDGQALKYLIAWTDPDAYIPCVWEGTCTPPSNPSCEWSKKLSSKFRDTLGGYLLIVGEEDIIPAWRTSQYDDFCTVSLSDHPYGEYNSSKPDRIVGRIIGESPDDLSTAINASIDGHPFDRSRALLVSGTDPDSGREKGWRGDINDYEDIINSEFTVTKVHWSNTTAPTGTSIEEQRKNEFIDNAKDKDVIAYRDHGLPDGWGYYHELQSDHVTSVDSSGNPVGWATDFPIDLGNTNPFVLSLCCLTGCYNDHTNPTCEDFHGGNDNFAEAFFDSGAAVFIGATEISYGEQNTEAGKWFFENWDDDEDIGTVFTQLERNKWDNGTNWKYWVWEYNLYGDPKFGKLTITKEQKEPKWAKRQIPTPSLDVEIPDYVVTTRDNLDYVRIPDGDLWLEKDTYQVPFYSVSLDYPQGYRVQDVTLTNRSGLVTDTGLHLPITKMYRGAKGSNANRNSSPPQGWFPALDTQYEWRVVENPDKTTTLIITMYPFYYDGQTTDVQFYKNYSFAIDYISTDVRLAIVRTDKAAYPQGESVRIDMGVNNTGGAQDVIVSTILKPYGSDTMIDSLPLSTLKNLSGYATFSDQWDSTGFNPGYYAAEVTLKDTSGNVLDTKAHMFRLGISSGEVASLTGLPASFDPGDTITLSMNFKNTGTIPITGSAIIKVKDQSGTTIREFKHPVTGLIPTTSITFDDTWDTTNEQEGVYTILSYVLFDSKSSEAMTTTISSLSDGDVAPLGSRDGNVNVGDALVALRFALNLETPTQEDIAHGDVAPLDAENKPNPDGVINVGDALVILRKALGIVSF